MPDLSEDFRRPVGCPNCVYSPAGQRRNQDMQRKTPA